jgi:hypothetical protein
MENTFSADKFIDVLQGIHQKLDDGFKGIYDRMRCIEQAAEKRQLNCTNRISIVEKHLGLQDASETARNRRASDRRYIWRYVASGAALAAMLAVSTMLWKLFILTAELTKAGVIK